jgi:Cyclic nucleotide-binding domain
MRIEGSVTAVSWIPSESVTGAVFRGPFEMGLSHYDEPPPEVLSNPDALLESDQARFINRLQAWIDVDDGVVIDYGHVGAGRIGSTTMALGRVDVTFAAIALPDRRRAEPVGTDAVRFEQTAGGRTGVPFPRRVNRPPFVQFAAPVAWTTLSLTLGADGAQDFELTGASAFPRHWVYDRDGRLAVKSATIDSHRWTTEAFGRHTPWGDTDSPALVTEVESALERELSTQIMRSGAKPRIRRLRDGEHLTEQGEQADEVFVLLDGILRVEVDGNALAEIGPGAVLGERAILESGHRTASLIALTGCTVAVADRGSIDTARLARIADTHRREDTAT